MAFQPLPSVFFFAAGNFVVSRLDNRWKLQIEKQENWERTSYSNC